MASTNEEGDTVPDEGKNLLPTNIQVYLRMRPMVGRCLWHSVTGKDNKTFVTNVPRVEVSTLHNAKTEYKFQFDGIFDQDASQEDVFQNVALPVVDDALRGINGTIFAYGQTGTGKTYTITGDAEAFEMRGIIPRALARVFEYASSCSSAEFTLAVSYLEIYQDRGYDLLVKGEEGNRLEDLQRVYAVTDHAGQIILRGLSVNPVRTEEEALSFLFVGDANRIVAETPLNDCSTRSHCIFTIWIASREHGSHCTRRAKLHLVDLAGSERVKVSGTRPGDSVFQEACSINLTLHYLEQVIVALHRKAAGQATHIPYRNSLMTSVLKDSLGGNCKTRMIATVALELNAIQETINTCRFAQAVAQIENIAAINEEEEASALIARLQKENEALRGQLQLITHARDEQLELTEEAKQRCRDSVEQFLVASGDDLELPVAAARDLRSADFCFRILRDKYKEMSTNKCESPCRRRLCREALQKLQLHIEQRDAEIATLLGILHQGSQPSVRSQNAYASAAITRAAVEAAVKGHQKSSLPAESDPPWLTGPEATALLKDRGRAFEILRRSARKAELLEADSKRLRQLHADAKTYAEAAARAKARIAEARANLEKIRIHTCLDNKEALEKREDAPEESNLLRQVANWRDEYIKNLDWLDATKRELKRVHLSVERSRKNLQENFEVWFNVVASRQMRFTRNDLPEVEAIQMSDVSKPAHDASTPSGASDEYSVDSKNKGIENKCGNSGPVVACFRPDGCYPWSTVCLEHQHCIASMPCSTLKSNEIPGDASKALRKGEYESTHLPKMSSVVNDECPPVSKIEGLDDKLQANSETPNASRVNPCSEKASVCCSASCSPQIDGTQQLKSQSRAFGNERRIVDRVYTGNVAADSEIRAFYDALSPCPLSAFEG